MPACPCAGRQSSTARPPPCMGPSDSPGSPRVLNGSPHSRSDSEAWNQQRRENLGEHTLCAAAFPPAVLFGPQSPPREVLLYLLRVKLMVKCTVQGHTDIGVLTLLTPAHGPAVCRTEGTGPVPASP